jgi:acyl-CoA synthetase (AMP-forming)/AMP-acid ligase II
MTPSGDLLYRAARQYGTRIAARQGVRSLTYAALAERSARFANAVHGLGLRPGDALAAFLDDRLENIEIYVGAALAGVVLVPVNMRFKAGETGHILADSGARMLVVAAPLAPVAAQVPGIESLGPLVALGDGELLRGSRAYEALLAAASATPPDMAREPEDVAIIGYTSGTTGAPKGAQASHRAIANCTRLQAMVQGMATYGAASFGGSFSFVSALWGVLYPLLYTGSMLRLVDATDLERWLASMEDDATTYTWLPSPLVRQFTAAVAKRPRVLASLQTIVHTGSKVPRDFIAALAEVVGDRLLETWGMTESVGPLTATTRPDWRAQLAGSGGAQDLCSSVGRPVPGSEVRIRGGAAEGELVVRASTLFSGYRNRPEADAEAFDAGWFRTGDVGTIDELGHVYITDRVKDVIVSGGMNVYPSEIELVLARLEGVREASVLGVADERWGETVAAAIVRAPGSPLSAHDVVAHVRARLASYKKPTHVLFVDALPRNAALKVQKPLLRPLFGPHTAVG